MLTKARRGRPPKTAAAVSGEDAVLTVGDDYEGTIAQLKELKGKKAMQKENVGIAPPRFEGAVISIRGTAPLVQNKMTRRAFEAMRATQELGQQAKSRRKREPKQFKDLHREAIHVSSDGWYGMPAAAFRAAMIDACRLVGFAMTRAKMSVFIVPDGFDADDGQPLVRLIAGEPKSSEMVVRLANGSTDIAVRPMWLKWGAKVTVRWDGDQFSSSDIANLMMRAGAQIGIGAGRPFSKESVGLGFGTFEVAP